MVQAKVVAAAAAAVDDIEDEETGPAEANYDYLLTMSIQSLTLEKVIRILMQKLQRSIVPIEISCQGQHSTCKA